MMLFIGGVVGYYPNHPEFLAFLKAFRLTPENPTPALVLADWLDEWSGEDRPLAERHADYIRAQCDPFYERRSHTIRGTRSKCAKLLDAAKIYPWDAPPAKAKCGGRGKFAAATILNSSHFGVSYRCGFPDAIYAGPDDLGWLYPFLATWQVPSVYVRIPPGGLTIFQPGTGSEWCEGSIGRHTDPVKQSQGRDLVSAALTRAFGEACPHTTFHATYPSEWRQQVQ
jgi:uncharacterized protein (TIGR02996 family)